MTLKPTSKRMSAEDSFFLYFERPHAPLHVGSLGIFEGTIPIEKAREGLASRLHLIPRYRQRPVFPPLFGGYPSWEDDPTFSLDRHVRLIEMSRPVTEQRLHEISAQIFAEPLPRDRPLWEMVVIQGLEGDRTAYITKVHHCLVDGVSGVELTLVLLDVSPSPPPPPAPGTWEPKPVPTPVGSWLEGVIDQVTSGMIALTEWQRELVDPRHGLRLVSELSTAIRLGLDAAMQWPEPAIWNKPVGKDRRISFVKMPFQEVRAIRSALGGTVNDVVLTILGGALGRYLKSHGQRVTDTRLRLMIPVNVRTEEQRGAMGNRVSMMLPQIPVGIDDPIARLTAIRTEMDQLKASDQGAAFDRLLGLVDNAPAVFSALAGRVGMLPGMINLACTNVPGPLIPLYGTGHRMLDFYPMLPLAGDMGLGVAIMSYDQSLYWGISSDPKIVPDVDAIGRLIDDELRALRDAAGVPATDLPAQIGARQAPPPQTKTARKSPSRTAPIGSANRKRKTATSAAPTSARKQSAPNAPSRGRTAPRPQQPRRRAHAQQEHQLLGTVRVSRVRPMAAPAKR
jgi:WS/DGAT/MGAT family acyltransferase